MSLATRDPTICPDCGDPIGVLTWAQPALFFHGGYGSTSVTRRVYCSCGYSRLLSVTTEAPDRRPRRLSLPEQIRTRIDDSTSSCWTWIGASDGKGYALMKWQGRTRRVHRVAFNLLVGPIPKGLQLDHLCRNRSCVNPAHLEPVTSRENTLRGNGPAGQHARKSHCKNGHEFTAENTRITPSGARECRACVRDRWEALRQRVSNNDPTVKHASIATHNAGCRCSSCVAAYEAYKRRRRKAPS